MTTASTTVGATLSGRGNPFQNLAISTASYARIQHYHIMEHPAAKYVRIAPLYNAFYAQFRATCIDVETARTRATLRLLAMMDEVAKVADWDIPSRKIVPV